MEKTLVIIKPDGVQRALIGKIISTFEDAGLKVVAMKMVWATKELAAKHYANDEDWLLSVGKKTRSSAEAKGIRMDETDLQIGQRIRSWLMDYITSTPIIALAIEGPEAITAVRKLVGSTAPAKADPSTIRGKYSTESYEYADAKKRPVKNLVHASEDAKNAEREISIWFTKKEIFDYKRADEDAVR